MGRDAEDIRQAFREMCGSNGTTFPAVVTDVNDKEFTCTVKRDERVSYFDVRLRSVVDGAMKGFAFVPTVGSHVIVSHIGGSNELYVAMFGEIDQIVATIDNTTVDISGNSITFNGGDLGGLVKIKELEENLNSLKAFVETIHGALPTAFSAVGLAMSASGTNGMNSYNASMAGKSITIKDMENEKVKH